MYTSAPKKEPSAWKQYLIFTVKLALIIAMIVVQSEYPKLYRLYKIPMKYPNALFFYVSSSLVIDFIKGIVILFYNVRRKRSVHTNFALAVRRIASVLGFFTLVMALFILFETNIVQVFTSLSIVAAAIALLSKDYISNLINGMILMFSDQIALNDYIKIGHYTGNVTDITFLNLRILTDDDDVVYIPNNTIMNSELVNYTQKLTHKISIEMEIEYKFIDSVADLEIFLTDSLDIYSEFIVPESHNLKTLEILKESARLKYQFTMFKPDRKLEIRIRRVVVRKVIEYIHRSKSVGESKKKSSE